LLSTVPQFLFMGVLTITVPFVDPVLVWMIVRNPNSHIFHRSTSIGLLFLNVYWYILFFNKWVEEFNVTRAKKTSVPEVKVKRMSTLFYVLKVARRVSDVKKRMKRERQMDKFSSIRSYSECDCIHYDDEE